MQQNNDQAAVAAHEVSTEKARNLFLVAALISFLLSISLWFAGSKEQGLFVGLWVPSILSLGALMLSRGGER